MSAVISDVMSDVMSAVMADVMSAVMSAVMSDVMANVMSDVMSAVMSNQILPGLLVLSQEPHERKLMNGPRDYDRNVDLPTNLRELTCGDIIFES
jgi:hypothetical protein